MSPRFVIYGTDIGVGKKPVQSGLHDETDREVVARLGGLPGEQILSETYRLVTPASPHLAARLDGVEIGPFLLSPPAVPDPLTIEAAGGLLV